MIKKFEHVGIRVKDMEESIAFYTKVLGCRLLERTNYNDQVSLAFLTVGDANCEIELIAGPGGPYPTEGKVDHFAFTVDDPDAELDRLRSHGVSLIDEQPEQMKNGCRIAFFYGPSGERLELFWRPEGAR